jgi:hypothetical protein
MRVYLQRKNGEFMRDSVYAAWDGFRLLGVETIGFEYEQIDELPLDRESLVVGGIGAVRRALARLGVAEPALHPAPPELRRFYGRRIWETTLAEVRQHQRPIFLKPLRAHKLFDGHVRRRELDDISRTAHLEEELPVLASEVVTFVSEWRCFVREGQCVGARPYRGDYRDPVPDMSLVEPCIAAFGRAAPAGYSLDLGRTIEGKTLVVEVNDGFSLGSYGLPSIPYAQLLEARWRELLGPGAHG